MFRPNRKDRQIYILLQAYTVPPTLISDQTEKKDRYTFYRRRIQYHQHSYQTKQKKQTDIHFIAGVYSTTNTHVRPNRKKQTYILFAGVYSTTNTHIRPNRKDRQIYILLQAYSVLPTFISDQTEKTDRYTFYCRRIQYHQHSYQTKHKFKVLDRQIYILMKAYTEPPTLI